MPKLAIIAVVTLLLAGSTAYRVPLQERFGSDKRAIFPDSSNRYIQTPDDELEGHCDEKEDGIYIHPCKCNHYVKCSNKLVYSLPCPCGRNHHETTKNVCQKSHHAKCLKTYKDAASAIDVTICSTNGKDIMQRGGNAVDGAVAASICSGTVNLMSSGIGGGGFMVVYDAKKKMSIAYDFRETAPAEANETMFVDRPEASRVGGLSVAVPSQVKGLWKVHQNHGYMKWSKLFDYSIDLAENGFKVTKALDEAIQSMFVDLNENGEPYYTPSPGLRKLLRKPDDSDWLRKGDLLVNKALAKTLKNIQKNGATDFYEGKLANNIVEYIQKNGGIITLDDMKSYKVKVRQTIKMDLPNNLKLHTMPAPGSGAVVAFIHNILSGYDFSSNSLLTTDDQFDFYQKSIESMKFGYAQRAQLGDPAFLPKENITRLYKLVTDLENGAAIRENKITMNETHDPSYYGGYWGKDDFGTSHGSFLDKNGNAVSTTNTINYGFGSLLRSESNGIVFNNEMDDFSTPDQSNLYGFPPSPANYIRPGKRPQSSMSPSIIIDKDGSVKMVIGASGGSRIISGIAEVIAKKLYLKDYDLRKSINSYRLHDQTVPNEITAYKGRKVPEDLQNKLRSIGHKYVEVTSKSVTQGIFVEDDKIYAVSDPRKSALADGY